MIHSTLHRASGKSPWRQYCHSPSSSSHSRYVERDRYFHAASNRVPQDQTPTNWETSTSGHHCYRQQNTYPRQNRTTKQHRMKIYYYNLKIYRIEIPDLNHLSTTQQHLTAF
ncbi:hypothetical protein BG000_007305 [Podila horticola]|nr:hypothetical protein BG000_007305 [Podila horticola]